MKIYEKHRDKLLHKNINARLNIWADVLKEMKHLGEEACMAEYIKRCKKKLLLTDRKMKKK